MKSRGSDRDRGRWVVFLLLLLLVPVCFAAGRLYPFLSSGPLRFDAKAWAEHPSLRERMLDDLLERYPPVGMEKAALERLLGPGVQSEYTDRCYRVTYGVRYDYIGELTYGGTFTLFYSSDGDICEGYQLPSAPGPLGNGP